MYREKIAFRSVNMMICLVALLTIIISIPSYATDPALNDMESNIDKQNEELYDGIMGNKYDGPNDLENMLRESDRKNAEGGREIDLEGIGSALEINLISLSLWARKFIVPFTIVLLLFNVFMLATSAKNYNKRKKYIIGSAFIYAFFLFILNLPVYLLWRSSMGPGTPFTVDSFYRFVESVAVFLKDNSLVLSMIVLAYGVISYIGSQNNLPRMMSSKFMMKVSVIMFILFQILPSIMKLAV